MRKLKKPLSILLSLIMVLGVFTIVPFSAGAATTVTFLNRNWDANDKKIVESDATTSSYTTLTSSITELDSGKYVLSSDVTYSKRLKVKSGANAEIILVNGKTLKNDKGIVVPENSTLTVYGQPASGDDKADSGILDVYNPDGAGIGAMDEEKAGSIFIRGGTVKATGGKKDAGIGTGKNHSSGYEKIEIYGGNVTAQGGEYGAGIGAGKSNDYTKCKKINIYGGTIKATGGDYGAGIGGGEDSSVYEINIYGCDKITANGGKESAGIGSGNEENNHGTINIYGGKEITAKGGDLGAGIGGGDDGNSGTINISGGDITAKGGENAAGIGGGEDSHGENITISGGDVKACSHDGAGIGGGEDGKEGNIHIIGGEVRCISERGAGIGGGNEEHTKGSITIDGGTVYSTSERGAGIGAGYWSDMESPITINGGTVYARSGVDYSISFSDLTPMKILFADSITGESGAGIGAGYAGSQDETITINGGTVMAFGGGAGPAYGWGGGAGIGGGNEHGTEGLEGELAEGAEDLLDFFLGHDSPDNGDGGEGDKVVITGGTVIAWGDEDASAIGYGEGGSSLSNDDLVLPLDYSVAYLDMEVSFKDIAKLINGKKTVSDILSDLANSIKFANNSDRVKRCQKEGQLVVVSPCLHLKNEYKIPWEGNFSDYHQVRCKHCYRNTGTWDLEAHDASRPCSKCGYDGDVSTYKITMNSHLGTEESQYVFNTEFIFPSVEDDTSHISDGYIDKFLYWRDVTHDGDTGTFVAGDDLTVTEDKSFEAVYEKYYLINFDETVVHGTLSTDVSSAPEGATVTVDSSADEGYKVDTITVDGTEITPDEDGNYTFTMPDHSVTVSGSFVDKAHKHYDAETGNVVMTFENYTTQNGGTITSNNNYYLADDEQTMRSISGNTTVNLCLKGHKLSIPNSLIVNNGATLNIYDCTGEGFITGGSIYVLNGGTVSFYGASIKGNTNASGVIIAQGGTFNMYAGSIKENTYESMVGGVYVSSGAQFNILGDVTIQSNYVINGDQTIDNNVYLEEGAKINIGAELTDKTRIGVSVKDNTQIPYVLTDGLDGKGTAANFSSDNEEYFVEQNNSGEAQLNRPHRLTFDANGGSGTMDYDSVTDEDYYLPGCDFTPPEGKRFYGWKIGDKVYMESARVTISGDTTAYAQWTDQLYNVWLDGHRVTVENKDDILGNGTASYDPSTNTLTLTNANIEIQEYKSGLSVGIRYNETSNTPFKIVLNGTNIIKDVIPDRNIDEKYGILQFGAAPSYQISGSGTLGIEMNAGEEDVAYYGIHTRKALTVDGTKVSVDIPGEEKTTGIDMMYTYSTLTLQNGAEVTINTGSNDNTYALASNEASTIATGGKHLFVENAESKFTAESGNKAFNENITLSDVTKARGAYVKAQPDGGLGVWDGATPLTEFSSVSIPGENTFGAHLVGHSISLDGDIAVNFYMELSDSVVNSNNDPYMLFNIPDTSKEYKEQKVYLKTKEGEQRTVAEKVVDPTTDKTYYMFKCRVAAKDMESEITAQMFDGKDKGGIYKYSVKQYADYLIAHQNESEAYKKAVPLVEAMITYGKNAGYYFDKTGDKPEDINVEIPAEYDVSTVHDTLPQGVTFAGATLSLKSQTTLSLYFKSDQGINLTCDGQTVDKNSADGEYVIRIRNIAAADLDKELTVKVDNCDAVTYSPLTYCYKAQSSTDTKLANTVKALYLYWVEADEYFAPVHVHTEATKQENIVAATCTTAGSYDEVTYCTECNEELGREHVDIPATGHTIVSVDKVPATHEESGTAAHYECSVCHKLFSNAAGTTQTTAEALAIPRIKNVDLSALTGDITLLDGDIVTGTLGGDYKITIADGATVTLKNADIKCLSNDAEYAGITPLGNATILLKGTNIVKGGYEDYPGINSADGYTLTIDGTGSLTASSGGRYYGCGIGGGRMIPAGNIVINGGNITAYGGNSSAGIGSGNGIDGRCGNITINGGTVTAFGAITNDATSNGAGIGCGTGGTCGNITINGGTVNATGGDDAAGIGSANNATCGDITIAATITKVTAGDNVTTIGAPYWGTCGTVTIAEGLSDTTTEEHLPGELYSKFKRVIVPTPNNVNLATLTGDYEAKNGDVLTGTLNGHYKITIASGASVTLKNAKITCLDENDDEFAGITPLGNATIILEGTNTVKGGNNEYPGIYVPENATLTIDGDGSLTASSNGYGCGIGAGYNGEHVINAGNIVINGGTITANGGTTAAGIGSSDNSSCGDISIFGGTVTATGGKYAAGIGSGYWGDCGDITIADTVTKVTATKGNSAPNSIGKGQNGTCGTVTIESGANVIQN